MTTSPSGEPTSTQQRKTLRALLLLPPFVLVVASIVLLASAPLSWGAAEVLDAPDWIPPIVGAIVALAGLWVGLYSLRHTAQGTRGDFSVFSLQLVLGILMFASGSAMMLTLAVQLPDTDTYARALDDDGSISIGAVELVVVSLVTGALYIGLVWVGAYLYSHAITNLRPNRISARLPGEVDGVGELLRRRG